MVHPIAMPIGAKTLVPGVQNVSSDAGEAAIESVIVPMRMVFCPPAIVTPFGLNPPARGVKQSVLTEPVMLPLAGCRTICELLSTSPLMVKLVLPCAKNPAKGSGPQSSWMTS